MSKGPAKICARCHVPKEATDDNFSRYSPGGGFRPVCRPCRSAVETERRTARREGRPFSSSNSAAAGRPAYPNTPREAQPRPDEYHEVPTGFVRGVEEADIQEGKNPPITATEKMAEAIGSAARDIGMDPRDITWWDFRRYMKLAWGDAHQLSDLFEAGHLSRVGGFYRLRDAYFGARAADPAGSSVERIRIHHAATSARRIENEMARERAALGEVGRIAALFPKLPPVPPPKLPPKGSFERVVNVVLSDLHFGSRLLRAEGTHDYGPHEEARRLAKVAANVAGYKPDHRKDSTLRVFLLGDTFENQLHDPRTGAPMAEQIAETAWLLKQFLRYQAQVYRGVDVFCVPGNHGRLTSRHPGRATFQKWDALETLLYAWLKDALSESTHVRFRIPLTPWVVAEGPGGRIFATHGDGVFNVGNPSRQIPVSRIEEQVNRLQTCPPQGEKGRFDAFIVGHVHKGMSLVADCGAWVLSNPPLVPPNGYANALGIMDSHCGQWVFESTPDHIVGDARIVDVGPEEDSDPELEKIIKPWPGLGKDGF